MRWFLVLAFLALPHWADVGGEWVWKQEDEARMLQENELEADDRRHIEMQVNVGKKMMLFVADNTNQRMVFFRWYHNGQPIAERLRRGCQATSDKMVCSSVVPQDAGLYELYGSDAYGNRYLLQSYNVKVKPQPAAGYWMRAPVERVVDEVEPVPTTSRFQEDCFCSEVTSRCQMAHLYRMKKSFNLSSAKPVDYVTPTASKEEPYVAVPGSFVRGNLITSYGGYLSFPVTNECYRDRSEPCVVLVDRSGRAIGHYLAPHHDHQPTLSVSMRETSWRLLQELREPASEQYRRNALQLDKFTFMHVLSNVEVLYVRGRYGELENTQLTIDLATPYDEGLGTVSTVEECFCHPGYAGLSCERCEKGYDRFSKEINPGRACISEYVLWQYVKRKHRLA